MTEYRKMTDRELMTMARTRNINDMAHVLAERFAAYMSQAKPEQQSDLVEALRKCAVALAAAISLLKNGPKTAAASDKVFDQMIVDYQRALDKARAALESIEGRL